jgi:uncharacterized protein
MNKLLILFAIIISISLVSASYPTLNGFVNDFTDKLTQQEEQLLTNHISEIEKNTSVEIAIVTVNTTFGEDRTLYAARVGEENGVGKKETDNGVIILWSDDNEKGGAIATGRGIESILNDAKVVRIGKKYRSLMDEGKFYEAFEGIISDMEKELEPGTDMTTPIKEDFKISSGLIISFVILAIVIFVLFIKNHFIDDSGDSSYYGGSTSYSGRTSRKSKSGSRSSTIIGSSSSDDDDDDDSSFGSSGSSFGGFGGGSFGGGGGKF